MGLAYRTTTFASLLHAIISMQLRARVIRGEYNFFYEDLNAVLSHPHIQTIAAAHADTITEYVNSHKLYNARPRSYVRKHLSLRRYSNRCTGRRQYAMWLPISPAFLIGSVLRSWLRWKNPGEKSARHSSLKP